MRSEAPKFRRPIWLFYGAFALFLALAISLGLTWWAGLMFAAVFAALPLLAWLTVRGREQR